MSPEQSPRFLADLLFKDPGGFPFTLVQPLVYESMVLDRIIIVPSGFQTDLASIPRPLWSILPPIGKYDAAAVLHDYFYQTNGVTRSQADAVLNEAMEVMHVTDTTRRLIYAGVRVLGWWRWRKYRSQVQPHNVGV